MLKISGASSSFEEKRRNPQKTQITRRKLRLLSLKILSETA